jgi:hypothetical protein
MRAERETGATIRFAQTFPKIPALVRHPVQCGKPECCCAHGERHESWRLVWRGPDGKQRRRYVRRAELEQVRAIVTARADAARAERRGRAEAALELRALMRLWRDLQRELRR